MDTDDLSNETREAVLITAEKFNHDLTLQFGVLAGSCKDDNDYLDKAIQLINGWRQNIPFVIDFIFFDDMKPDKVLFEKILFEIEKGIQEVQRIPIKQRKFEY
jgi:hypothetical protein